MNEVTKILEIANGYVGEGGDGMGQCIYSCDGASFVWDRHYCYLLCINDANTS